MMTLKTCDKKRSASGVALQRFAAFLAEYAALLYGCGATSIRIEKNAARMARAFGINFYIFIMPAHVSVTVWDDDESDAAVAARRTAACGVSFNLNARLSRLSWVVADQCLSLEDAAERFEKIKQTKPTGKWEVLVLTSIANASFCHLFGGDGVAMIIVFISTLVGYRLKQIMLEDGRDVRLTFLCASFFSASLSAAGHIFNIGGTPEIALGTSVLYLIPGIPYLNSVSDVIYRHYLCALSRFFEAAILTACLSAGLCAGMLILGLKTF